MNYFVTAIGTDSGKSVVSALLTSVLDYAYWKPIQAGEPADSDYIRQLVLQAKIYPETYKLNTACSPHESARIDGVEVELDKFHVPQTENLIIEGAGGVFVPINHKNELIIDLIEVVRAECVVVSNHYLGSINHTLLTIKALQDKGIKIKGIIFNGAENKATESVILAHSNVPFLFRIDQEKQIDADFIKKYAPLVKKSF